MRRIWRALHGIRLFTLSFILLMWIPYWVYPGAYGWGAEVALIFGTFVAGIGGFVLGEVAARRKHSPVDRPKMSPLAMLFTGVASVSGLSLATFARGATAGGVLLCSFGAFISVFLWRAKWLMFVEEERVTAATRAESETGLDVSPGGDE